MPTDLDGVVVVELERHDDDRGSFARTLYVEEFAANKLPTGFPQCNLATNRLRGTLRGMHYEPLPSEESKLVRCTVGSLFDVVVDLRPGSPTRHRWIGVELSRANGRALFVPAGCGHGYLTLEDDTDVWYHMGAAYRPGAGQGFRWDDPAFDVRWPFPPIVVAARDAGYPDYVGD